MRKDTFGLPQNVYDAFVRKARSKMIEHYFGDGRRLKPLTELTDSCDQFPVLYIYGCSLFEAQGKCVRLCRKLVGSGRLVECWRSHDKEAVRFKLSDDALTWYLLGAASDYWKSKGYVEGVIMDKVH